MKDGCGKQKTYRYSSRCAMGFKYRSQQSEAERPGTMRKAAKAERMWGIPVCGFMLCMSRVWSHRLPTSLVRVGDPAADA